MKFKQIIALVICLGMFSPAVKAMKKLAQSKEYTLKKHIQEKENCHTLKKYCKTCFTFFDNKKQKVCSVTLCYKHTQADEHLGDLNEICIEQKFQGQGLGTLLFKNIVDYFKKHNCKKFTWSAYPLDVSRENYKTYEEYEENLAKAQEKLVQWYEHQGGIVDGSYRGLFAIMYYTIK
jgi:GNAT superfamily N-acetyltransferase